jgi:hypothetical protein
MRNWTGAALLSFAAWLLYSGLAHHKRILAARRDAVLASDPGQATTGNGSLARFGGILRPLIIIGLGYLALKVTLAYVLLDAGRVLSLFDLAGFLLLLTAYGIWLILNTTYREATVPIAGVVRGGAIPIAPAPIDDGMDSPAVRASEAKARELVSPL